MAIATEPFVYATNLNEVRSKGAVTHQIEGRPVVFFAYGERIYAVDNRCPHMGFPLDKGTIQDGILTCHWHHARFDLASGGTFDLWTDDVEAFPVEIREDEVWIDLSPNPDQRQHHTNRLQDGLEHNLSLVIAKAVIRLLEAGEDPAQPFKQGVLFGVQNNRNGWGRGLTTHACFMNLIPFLNEKDRPRALYHGLSDVASDVEDHAPHFDLRPLPNDTTDIPTLKRWFRQFIEVRDRNAAERCIVSAVRAGADDQQMADMLFAAATDHRYIDVGHPLDFTNKAFESLDLIGWEHAEQVLASIVPNYTNAMRMEESNAWRYPIDLIDILADAFSQLPSALQEGDEEHTEPDYDSLVEVLFGEDPQAIANALLSQLRSGVEPVALAGVVTYAAALRIAQFPTSNEFGDWDTALHTFTFANAVQQGLIRVRSEDLMRGIFDAAMSVYLDRFLNVPSVKLPASNGSSPSPDDLLTSFPELLNLQQQVNPAGKLVSDYLANGDAQELMAQMGRLLLREDRNFHTIQCVEAGFQQYTLLEGSPMADHVLIAVARYLAAHAPTMRSQGQTYGIAERLSRGEVMFEE